MAQALALAAPNGPAGFHCIEDHDHARFILDKSLDRIDKRFDKHLLMIGVMMLVVLVARVIGIF